MARLPDDEIDRIKREVSVQRLAEARGVALRPHGSDLIGLCPFHNDRQPSLVITPKKNLWHCLGACQAGGSVIDWVMKAEGISFRHAAELLRDGDYGGNGSSRVVRRATVPKLPALADGGDADLLGQVANYYHSTLKESQEALAYLEGRGLKSSEMIDRFRLGFANRTLGYRLPRKNRKAGAEVRGRLQELGVLRGSGHEHFNGSVVIPVFDEGGNVTEMYGRKVRDDLRPGTPTHLYLPGPHRGVWNIEALAASREVILCEALLDALTFWCHGFRNVTASYGIEGFTDDHMAAFRRHGTERVLVAYDRDDAGERAAASLAQRLMAGGIECYRVHFPKGMDANEYALKVQPAPQSLGVVIRAATWLGKGRRPDGDLLREASPPEAGAAEVVEPATAKEEKRRAASTCSPIPETESAPAAKEEKVLATAGAIEPEPLPSAVVDEEAAKEETEDALPLAASPQPAPPPDDMPVEVKEEEVVMRLGDRRYRVRGLSKNMSFDQMRVNILVSRSTGHSLLTTDHYHVDTIDLYTARHRASFTREASVELDVKEGVIKKDLGRVLLRLEQLQEEQITKALTPEDKTVRLTNEERDEALALLRDRNLLDRILDGFDKCGVVGERTNKLVGYLAAVSRKLDEPLAIIIQSSSAAGKSALMEAVLSFVPEEDRVQYSAMTGQSLFYMGESDLKNKILAIAEEEGAQRAGYALKLLQSEGELTIASTGKDPASGRLVTHEYRVEGPVQILMTTTAIDIDEELLNRAIVLTVDEDREQTKAIHRLQRHRQTLRGLLDRRDRDGILKTHRNAQRLLRPLLVANPYANELTFMHDQTRTRRDHMKYLTLIRAIALLHQHQREVRTVNHDGGAVEYIEVTPEDIAVANRLADEVLGRSLDELPPQTRRLLMLIDAMVTERCRERETDREDLRFTRRDVREHTGWSDPQVRTHLDRLVSLEHVLVHRGGRGQSFVYELLYDGRVRDGRPFMPGLIDVRCLRQGDGGRNDGNPPEGATTGTPDHDYDTNIEGQNGDIDPPKEGFDPRLTPHSPPIDGGLRDGGIPANALNKGVNSPTSRNPGKTHMGGKEKGDLSYAHACRTNTPGGAA